MAAGKQNLRRQPHGFGKIRRQGCERRKKQIAEAVPFESRSFSEAVAEELGEQGLVFAQGDDAVAYVARGKHVEFFAQTATGATIVADRNHGAQISNDRRVKFGRNFRGPGYEALKARKQRGKSCTAADSNNAQSALARGLLREDSAALVSIEGVPSGLVKLALLRRVLHPRTRLPLRDPDRAVP